MSNLHLYELANQFHELENIALTEDIPSQVVADTLEGLQGEFNDKAIACAKFVLNLEASAAAIAEAAKAMSERAARVQRRADSVRAYMLFQLQSIDVRRIDCAEFVIRRAVNPPAVQVADEGAIPADYWVQPDPPPPRLDKKLLRSALQSGAPVRGAYLESSERLDIKQ